MFSNVQKTKNYANLIRCFYFLQVSCILFPKRLPKTLEQDDRNQQQIL